MSTSIIIPSLDSNRFSKELGDLFPFGQTTLIEWKVAQVRKMNNIKNIYILSDSNKIKKLAENLSVSFIERSASLSFISSIKDSLNKISSSETILLCSVTHPFVDDIIYEKGIKFYKSDNGNSFVLATQSIREYIYYKSEPLNFSYDNYISRTKVEPAYYDTTAFYVFNCEKFIKFKGVYGNRPIFLNLDHFNCLNIENIENLKLAETLIPYYFYKKYHQ